MKVVVTGGQNYVMTLADYQFLENAVAVLRASEFITAGAPGVDLAAETWAYRRGIPTRRITPDWTRYGCEAIFHNNRVLAQAANAVIAFPGGPHSADMVEQARHRECAILESPSRQLENLSTITLMPAHRAGARSSL